MKPSFPPAPHAVFATLLALTLTPSITARAERPKSSPAPARPNPFAETTKTKAAPVTMEATLNLGNITEGSRFDSPSQGLAFALRAHPGVAQFRLTWSLEVAQSKVTSTLFYHRRKQTLTFYSSGALFGARVFDHWRDRGVSEALLFRLADKHRGSQTGDNTAHFRELARMGSKRESLGRDLASAKRP